MFWMRSNNVGPYLVLTPLENTKFEYWDVLRPADLAPAGPAGRGTYRVYIHSSAAGAEAKAQGTKWRQPNTNLKLSPKGQPDDSVSYGFKLHWADDYDAVRQLLVDEGLVDVHIVPCRTISSPASRCGQSSRFRQSKRSSLKRPRLNRSAPKAICIFIRFSSQNSERTG